MNSKANLLRIQVSKLNLQISAINKKAWMELNASPLLYLEKQISL